MARLRVGSHAGPENMRDWLVPIQRGDSRQDLYELQPIETPNTAKSSSSWKSLFIFTTRAHWVFAVFSGSGTILSGLLKPVASVFFGRIFSLLAQFGGGTLGAKAALHDISIWCVALTVLGVSAWIAEFIFQSAWIIFGESQARSARSKMFRALLDRDQRWYDLREDGIGSLLIRIQTQIRELQLALSQPLGLLFFETVAVLTSLGIAFYSTWKLTLALLATLPFVCGILYLVSRGLAPAIEAQKRELSKASKFANTAVTAIDTVKAFNGQNQELWQYNCAVKEVTKYYLLQARINALQFGIIKFLMVGLFVQGFWLGIYLVNNGLDPGHVLTAFYACLSALQAAEVVLPQWLVLAKGISAGETLKSVMREIQDDRGRSAEKILTQPESCAGDLEINNVCFAYPSNAQQYVLSNVSLFFPSGEMTFVVGPSGSGKSTIGNLLMKYYKPLSGDILVDCRSIQTIDTSWVRRNITLVQQDSVLFNETIRQNISFGNRDMCGLYDIHRACETACLRETIEEMPDGLDTVVGLGGRTLSGGQQQRVAIARARIRDASILILDESTSALDHTSRLQVMAKVREWRKGKTTIIITHDISQILDDDYIYVLDDAKVVQEGYRKNLDATMQARFAPLLCHDQTMEQSRQIKSYVPSGVTETCEENFPYHSRYIPKVFYVPSPSSSCPSFSIPDTQPNTFKPGFRWSPHATASTPQLGNSRSPSGVSFLSPLSTPRTPSPIVESRAYPLRGRVPRLSYERPAGFPLSRNRSPAAGTEPSSGRTLASSLPLELPAAESILSENYDGGQNTAPASLTKIFGTIWPTLTLHDRIIFVLGFFAAFIVGASTPAFGYVFARLLGVFYLPQDERARQALKFALCLLGIAILDGLACFCAHYMLEFCAQLWVTSLRLEALKRILAQPKSWFEDKKNSPNQLNECLDRNAEEMRNLVGRFAGPVFSVIWMLGISVVAAFIISWKITLVALACGPVVYIITRIFHMVSSKWEDRCNRSAEHSTSIFTETIANIRVVKALTLEDYFTQKHNYAMKETYKTGISRALYTGSLFGLSDALNFFITALIFYYGTVLVASGSHSVNSMIQVVNLLLFGIANASSMLSLVPQIGSSRATASSMLRLTNLPLDASHETQGSRRLATPLPIQLTDLSLTYTKQPHVKILSNISLRITAGTCTAIVGPSGSGKSTILSILQCLYPCDPPQFLISPPPLRFAGVSVENCSISALRSQISVVPQAPVLFPSSILDNIIYGLPETSPFRSLSAAQRAAEQAGIHSFIMSLDVGYETIIGDGGMGISGGQAQRIAIARALVRRPKVLILDEPTSALDGENAEGVRSVVRALVREGMAVVVVSHAVEMMRVANWVVVIAEGRMVEEGEFDHLCAKNGALAKLIGIEGSSRR